MLFICIINVLRPEILYNACLLMLFLFARKTLVLCPLFVYAIFVLGSIADSSTELYTELAILLSLVVGIMECIMGLLRYFHHSSFLSIRNPCMKFSFFVLSIMYNSTKYIILLSLMYSCVDITWLFWYTNRHGCSNAMIIVMAYVVKWLLYSKGRDWIIGLL